MARPRRVDNQEVLDAIRAMQDEGLEFNSQQLGERVGMSRPSINRRLSELEEDGVIERTQYRNKYGHRRYTVTVKEPINADA